VAALLEQKVVLVTGAGAGVGRGIARACAAAGARVAIAALREESGREVVAEIEAAGGSALALACDVSQRSEVDAAVAGTLQRFGGLDALVHNATHRRSPEACRIEEASAELLDQHVSVSLRGAYHCAQAAFAALRERRGRLVLLSSAAALEGSAERPLYAMVKAAERGFAKSLAREWGPFGIAVNAVSPLALTPALARAIAGDPGLESRLRALSPLGWIGDPEHDVGAAVALLLSDAARYVTGQTWIVDGGRFTGL